MLLCCSPKGSLGPRLSHPEYLTNSHQLFCTYSAEAGPLFGEYLLDHDLDHDLDPAPSSGSMASQILTSSCVKFQIRGFFSQLFASVPPFFPTGGRMEWVHKSWIDCRGRPGASFVVVGFLLATFIHLPFIHLRTSCSEILSSSVVSSAFHDSFRYFDIG
ncbi:hypothetical protein GALMADRAFT_240787, partial [Galerina marginata CBS 339.88]